MIDNIVETTRMDTMSTWHDTDVCEQPERFDAYWTFIVDDEIGGMEDGSSDLVKFFGFGLSVQTEDTIDDQIDGLAEFGVRIG